MKTLRNTTKLMSLAILSIGLMAFIAGCKETTASTTANQEAKCELSACSAEKSCCAKTDANCPCPKDGCPKSCDEKSCSKDAPKCSQTCPTEQTKECYSSCKSKASCSTN